MNNLDRATYRKVSGIYRIYSTFDNRCYIGSASCLYRRINNHINQLRKGKHTNQKLLRFYNKYGEEHLSLEVVELCSKELLIEKENYYIQYYKACEEGFNITPYATSIDYVPSQEKLDYRTKRLREELPNFKYKLLQNLEKARIAWIAKPNKTSYNKGKKATEETKLKQSLAAKNRLPSFYKEVNQYDLEDNFIQSWPSCKNAGETLNISYSNIVRCCKNKGNRAGIYKWKYK